MIARDLPWIFDQRPSYNVVVIAAFSSHHPIPRLTVAVPLWRTEKERPGVEVGFKPIIFIKRASCIENLQATFDRPTARNQQRTQRLIE